MKLKKLLAFGLALVMCLAMAACGTNPDEKPEESTSQTDAEPVSITVTENWDFSVGFYPVITPMVSSTYGAGFWSRNFYNTLVSYDDNGKIQGELAETWEISDDGKTYTFHLRDGVKFSDGTPLTSEAVKMTLEAVVTHLGPQNGAFGKLTTLFDKLETPDEKTFVMTLKTPYYAALDNLTMALPLGIVNPAAFEGGVEKAYENCVSATMGTGPYMFDRVEGDSNVAHVPAGFPRFDIAAFLYELRHRLHRFLKVHRIFEGDASIGPLHISDGPAAQTLIRSFIDIGIIGDDLPHQIDVHTLLEKQRADATRETIQRSGQRSGEYFRQKRTGVLRVQVADIELERIHHELASAAAVILLQMCIDLSVHILRDPESLFDLVVVFH